MRNIILLLSGLLIVACGGKKQEETTKVISVEDYETSTFSVSAGDGSVEGLLGNVTQDEIERVFSENRSAMMRCYESALEDVEEIEGDLQFDLEVASDGSVQSAFISSSNLGAIAAEECMLSRIKSFHFKRAPGGVAVFYYPMTLEAPYDPPDPDIWNNARVAKVLGEHTAEVEACLSGVTGVHVTAYVGKGGMVLSAGAAGDESAAYECAVCLARAARSWVFQAPPSNDLVKVRLDF